MEYFALNVSMAQCAFPSSNHYCIILKWYINLCFCQMFQMGYFKELITFFSQNTPKLLNLHKCLEQILMVVLNENIRLLNSYKEKEDIVLLGIEEKK